MARRKSKAEFALIERSSKIYLRMQKAASEDEFRVLRDEWELVGKQQGVAVERYETLEQFKYGPPRNRDASALMRGESPVVPSRGISRSELGNLESISWYLKRIHSRMETLNFSPIDPYLQAVIEADNALSDLLSILSASNNSSSTPESN